LVVKKAALCLVPEERISSALYGRHEQPLTQEVDRRREDSHLIANAATHRLCYMKKITLSVDEKVLAAVRRYAAERDSSVNALVREFLTRISQSEDRARNARRRIRELSNRSRARIGSRSWTREELHDR